MSPCTRSTQKSNATSTAGFTVVEVLMGVVLMGLVMAATSGMFVASKNHLQLQARELETTQAARAALDMIVRDLRLGGACLPVTGDFISLDGTNTGHTDEIITRTGLTRSDLSCVSSVIPTGKQLLQNSNVVPVANSDGFAIGMRAYIRHPDGTGEYFTVSGVPSATQLAKTDALSRDYPETSGIYAIDQRRFFIESESTPSGLQPVLKIQVGTADPSWFAVGIEKLDVQYQLQRNCPPCDVVDLPSTDDEWSIVDVLLLSITARSMLPDAHGSYDRRTVSVNVKPRNLLPR